MPRPNRYLPGAKDVRRVRLDLERAEANRLEVIANSMGLSLASFVRLVAEMYGRAYLSPDDVKAEADRRRGGPLPEPPPPKPRGRPRKKPAEDVPG